MKKYDRLVVEKEWAKKIKTTAKRRGQSAFQYLKAVEERLSTIKE